MNEFKALDEGKPFLQPEKPFLLIYRDADDVISFAWLEDEDDIKEVAKEVESYGCEIIDAIEIGSCRDVILK